MHFSYSYFFMLENLFLPVTVTEVCLTWNWLKLTVSSNLQCTLCTQIVLFIPCSVLFWHINLNPVVMPRAFRPWLVYGACRRRSVWPASTSKILRQAYNTDHQSLCNSNGISAIKVPRVSFFFPTVITFTIVFRTWQSHQPPYSRWKDS